VLPLDKHERRRISIAGTGWFDVPHCAYLGVTQPRRNPDALSGRESTLSED